MLKKQLLAAIFIGCFVFSAAAEYRIAVDPIAIGVGARPLGMGKAFTAIEGDPAVIFMNPAGLGTVDRLKLSSMGGKLLNEYNYLNLAATWPVPKGSMGIAYVGSGISFLTSGGTVDAGSGIIYPTTTEGSTFSNANNVLLLAWALPLSKKVTAGSTAKLYFGGLTGPGMSQTFSGWNVDLGLQAQVSEPLRLGASLNNALPFAAGGKVSWNDGTNEYLPMLFRLGGALRLIGDDGLEQYGEQKLTASLDGEYSFLITSIPPQYRLGLEWQPLKMLAFRIGLDQDITGSGSTAGVANNLTAGLGLTFRDFRFDYAFHQYSNLADNDTHYFSISYGVGELPLPKDLLVVTQPPGWSTAYADKITVSGRTTTSRVHRVQVGDELITPDDNGRFSTEQQLKRTKNVVPLLAVDRNGKILQQLDRRVLMLASFPDVNDGNVNKEAIEYLATMGVIAGYPDGNFRPDGKITRAELCSLLIKARPAIRDLQPGTRFEDVPAKHWASGYIDQAVAAFIASGYPDGTFKPNDNISRLEGILMVGRFDKLGKPRVSEAPYADIPARHWAVAEVTAAKEAGLLDYLKTTELQPEEKLTRGEAAAIIYRTAVIKEKLNDLKTF
ncbi:MAG: S-layer homology domain-containing protein [Candidatus Margulisiibacteriota bacterium]